MTDLSALGQWENMWVSSLQGAVFWPDQELIILCFLPCLAQWVFDQDSIIFLVSQYCCIQAHQETTNPCI